MKNEEKKNELLNEEALAGVNGGIGESGTAAKYSVGEQVTFNNPDPKNSYSAILYGTVEAVETEGGIVYYQVRAGGALIRVKESDIIEFPAYDQPLGGVSLAGK